MLESEVELGANESKIPLLASTVIGISIRSLADILVWRLDHRVEPEL
jgi:hypothetical protein